MEPNKTPTNIVNFSLKCEEGLQLGVHFDLTDREQVFLLDSVALHMALDYSSCIIPLLFVIQS